MKLTQILIPHIDAGAPRLKSSRKAGHVVLNYPDQLIHPQHHGDLLRANLGKTIVTFSEHILLTALRMIRDRELATPDLEISILMPDGNIKPMRHNEQGELIDEWADGSGGFFEQRFNLYF